MFFNILQIYYICPYTSKTSPKSNVETNCQCENESFVWRAEPFFDSTHRLHHFHNAINVTLGVLVIRYVSVVYLVSCGHAHFGKLGQADIAHQFSGRPHLLLGGLQRGKRNTLSVGKVSSIFWGTHPRPAKR